MPILQSMEGKFYDIPDEEASSFEVPREKVKELLEKSGAPVAHGAPTPAQGPGQMPVQGPGPGQGAPPPSVLVQIYGAQPSYGPPPGQQMQQPPSPQGEPTQGGGDGEVNPYWWWRNITVYRPWGNFWPNWGNW